MDMVNSTIKALIYWKFSRERSRPEEVFLESLVFRLGERYEKTEALAEPQIELHFSIFFWIFFHPNSFNPLVTNESPVQILK